MKYCIGCEKNKELSEFYKDKRAKDGLYTSCKNCHFKAQKKFFKKYRKTERYKKNKKKDNKKYHKTDKYKKYQNKYQKEYQREYHKRTDKDERKKYLCRQKTNWLIREGVLIKQPCEVCEEIKTQAHHEDYDKPLEVNWLCKKHHVELHLKQKEKK